jgi:4-diphosphocytidyl-2-C-methyl-D-erythritol kinase
MRGEVTVTAPAKVNLCLGVGPVRTDGFHPLATVYQAIGLYDRVTVRDADEVSVVVRGDPRLAVAAVPTDEANLAVRAARLLAAHHRVKRGVEIVVDKGIPVAGGLGGGSADAAATLLACDRLWDLRTPREEMLQLAADLGSDVPFGLVGGTAVGSGRGELVTPLATGGTYWWVVLESVAGLATPSVYREFDVMMQGCAVELPRIPDGLLRALRGDDVAELGAALANDLQEPALRLRPELRVALERGRAASAHAAVLSGSGPSCLFLCGGRGHAVRVADALTAQGLGPVSFAPGPVPGARVVAPTVAGGA